MVSVAVLLLVVDGRSVVLSSASVDPGSLDGSTADACMVFPITFVRLVP